MTPSQIVARLQRISSYRQTSLRRGDGRKFRVDKHRNAYLDRIGVRMDKSSVVPVKGNPGMIDVWGVATRVGVFVYDDEDNPGQIIRERRPSDEVMSQDSLDTLLAVPFTADHPSGEVTSGNASDLTHGWVTLVEVSGHLVKTRIRVTTDAMIERIRSGIVELSCGYTARLVLGDGVTAAGERFDATQRDIVYNHLADVDLARAGAIARLQLDGRGRRGHP